MVAIFSAGQKRKTPLCRLALRIYLAKLGTPVSGLIDLASFSSCGDCA